MLVAYIVGTLLSFVEVSPKNINFSSISKGSLNECVSKI